MGLGFYQKLQNDTRTFETFEQIRTHKSHSELGGGFKYLICLSLPEEMIQFDLAF